MILGTVVEVAISLASIYLIAALIASAIQETLSSVFQWRGKYFAKAVEAMVDNGAALTLSSGTIGKRLRSFLSPGGTATAPTARPEPPNPPPAPDSPEAKQYNADVAVSQLSQLHTHPLLQGSALPSYVDAKDFSLALIDVLKDGSGAPVFRQVEATIAKLPNGGVKRVLTAFVQDAGGDLDKLRAGIEGWFDNTMDRVAGLYKRFSHYLLLVLGIVLAVVMNIDTLRIARALWSDPTTRATIVAKASSLKSDGDQKLDDLINQLQATLPIARTSVDNFWGNPDPDRCKVASPPAACARPAAWPITVIIGWLISALAISLGAPFWFDLLSKFMNVRAAGAKPDPGGASS